MDSHSISPGRMFWIFLKLGATSFGGPIAHLALFRREFVQRRQWLDEAEYAELIALCQSLPGPSSSQVALLLAHSRGGFVGSMAGFVGFTLPGAVLLSMAAFWLRGPQAPWTRGLRVFAVAIVCQALWSMARNLAPDLRRRAIGFGAGVLCAVVGGGMGQILAIASGWCMGQILCKEAKALPTGASVKPGMVRVVAPLAMYVILLVAVVALPLDGAPLLVRICGAMYRAGALVFGGGHVVLPLLSSEVVGGLGLPSSTFLSGYGLVQGMPGPIFNIAAWIGASMTDSVGAACATLSIFLPGILVALGARPVWSRLRGEPWFQRGIAGTNAAVVGILLAALVLVVIPDGIRSVGDGVLALAALSALALPNWPPWVVAILCATISVGIGAF